MKNFINIFFLFLLIIGFSKLSVIAYEGITGMGCKLPTIEKNNKIKKQNQNKLQNNKSENCQLEFEKTTKQTKNKMQNKKTIGEK